MQSSDELLKALSRSLSEARSLPRPDLSGDLLIISSQDAAPAARVLYVGALSSGARAVITGATEASVLLMPYREVNRVVAYALSPRDSRVVRAVEEALVLGSEVYLIAPPLHEALEERLSRREGLRRIEVPTSAPLMTMIFASALWSPRPMGARSSRVEAELQALDEAPQWVLQTFSRQATEVANLTGFSAFYTPAAEPGARYLCLASDRCDCARPLDELARFRGGTAVLIETTSESHDYGDVEIGAAARGARIVKVVINTDPITAGVYSAIFGAIATGRVL